MKKSQLIFFLTLSIFSLHGTAQQLTEADPEWVGPDAFWESGFKKRLNNFLSDKDFQINIKDANNDPDAGKRVWPPFLAALYKARDSAAIISRLINTTGAALIQSKWAGSFYKPFTLPGFTMYYFQYKDRLPADQLASVRKHLYDKGWD